MTGSTEVVDFVQCWAAAEERNDAGALAGLLADDFAGVGPLGFVVPREGWPARFVHRLENRAFTVEEPHVRDYGPAAVVIGVLHQQTSYQGQDNSGRFRVTLVAIRRAEDWVLAGVHIGPLQIPGGG